jgi:hypothetical protein
MALTIDQLTNGLTGNQTTVPTNTPTLVIPSSLSQAELEAALNEAYYDYMDRYSDHSPNSTATPPLLDDYVIIQEQPLPGETRVENKITPQVL